MDMNSPLTAALTTSPAGLPAPVTSATLPPPVKNNTNVVAVKRPGSAAPPVKAIVTTAQPAQSQTPVQPAAPPPPDTGQVPEGFFSDTQGDLEDALAQLKALNSPANAPTPPVAQYLPPPPQTKAYNPIEAWGSAAMMIAGLGSLLTRQSMTTAISSAATVMNAYKQGDSDTAASALATWKAQTANALNLQKYELSQYTDALSAHSDDVRQVTGMVTAIASATKDEAMLNVLQSQGPAGALALATGRATAAVKAAKAGQDVSDYAKAEGTWASWIQANPPPTNPADKMDYQIKARAEYASLFGRSQALSGADPSAVPQPDGFSDQEIQALVDQQLSTGVKQTFPAGKEGRMMAEHFNQILANTLIRNASSGGTQPGQLTPDAIDGMAQVFIETGKIPNLGWGKSGAVQRSQVINRAFQLAAQQGIPFSQFVTGAADLKANESTLITLQRNANAAHGYEQTTMDNIGIAKSLMPAGVPTDLAPWLNQIVQKGEIAAGQPGVPAYAAALNAAISEYAKVMAGATGSAAAVSDSARQEAQNLLNTTATSQTADAVFKVMEQDMQNKERDYAAQIAYVQYQMGQGQPSYGYAGYQPPAGDGTTPPPAQAAPPPPAAPAAPAAPSGSGWSIQQVP
jgi:hypothetical protein